MKALTVCQPWAWAIAAGHKQVENRTWKTSYRGPLAIHAGCNRKAYAGWWGLMLAIRAAWARVGRRQDERMAGGFDPAAQEPLAAVPWPAPDAVPYGAVVAVAELVDCLPFDATMRRQCDLPEHELYRALHQDPFATGPWCWVLRNVRAIEPVPAKGQMGLWNWVVPCKLIEDTGGEFGLWVEDITVKESVDASGVGTVDRAGVAGGMPAAQAAGVPSRG